MINKKRNCRALHLIDIENQLGGGKYDQRSVEIYRDSYFAQVPQNELDQFFLASNPAMMSETAFGWSKSAAKFKGGKNGADDLIAEYLSDLDYVKNNFCHVFIASGDGRFVSIAKKLIEMGVKVTMVRGLGRLHQDYFDLDIEVIDLENHWCLVA